jgi:HEAT repeat protein
MRLASPPTITVEAALRDLQSRDGRTRAAAAHALGDAPADARDAAADALVAALSDLEPDVRATAALALAEHGLERAVEPIALCLDDGAPGVRQAAAVALGRLGLAAGFAPLADALRRAPPDVRFQAVTSLVEIDPERAAPLLLRALDDDDGEVVGAAALGLGAIGDRTACDRLAALLGHGRRETRFEVAYALARLGDARATATLAEFVADPALGWDAVEALELAGQPTVVAPLARAAFDDKLPREVVLRAAAALLAVAPDAPQAERARTVLLRGLSALRYRYRALAVELLGQVGGPWARAPLARLGERFGGRTLAGEIAAALRKIEERP